MRCYFVLFLNDAEIIISDEYILGKPYTKFIGGGLEFGEGIIDCLKREAIEELGQEIEVLEHIYTTDFFQSSWFDKRDQILSIYYSAKLKSDPKFEVSSVKEDVGPERKQRFRKVRLSEINESELSFPIDKYALPIIKRISSPKF